MRGKLNMNPQTKRAVVVLSIIALLILIIGVRSCSKQFRQTDKNPAGTEQTESSPEPSGGGIVIDPAPSGGETQPGPSTGSSDITSGEDGASTGQEDGSGKNTGSKPAASSAKPSSSTKPVSSTKPTTPVKPAEPSPTPSAPAQPTPSEPTAPTTPAQPTPPATPGDTDNSGSGSGGHHSYPAAVVEITVPDYSHADTEFQVKTTLLNVKSLEWAVSEDGSDAKQSDFLKGTLDKDGGKITITKQGSYTLTATAKNYGGSTYTFTKKITIHPVYGITVTTKPYAHTDQAFTVSTTLSDNITQQLNWHVYKDGNEMKWADTVTGTLTNVGGSIQIKDKGKYTLKATAYDETSREFAGTAEVEVLPVVEISLQASETAHTDTPALLSAETKELGDLQIAWGATKDGTKVNLSDCTEGKLDNLGGSIRFKEPGDYTITAAATDKSGRTFTAQTESKVYPVAGFSFTLPATAHTDETVPVSVQSSDLQDIKAEWTVLHNGESVPLFDMLEGTLTNEGGSIRFREKGSYVLKATLVDETGREYSYEAGMVIYPVAETGFYLPPATHTDTDVEVMTSFKDTDGLTAVWSLTKDGTALSLADGFNGTLTDSGGKIHFKSVGDYELTATITDSTGRSFTYTAPVTVYPVITVSVELTEETHTDQAATASVELTNAGPLPVVWSISKNGIPATPDNTLTNSGGTISFTEKGDYTVTAAVTDKAGRTFSDSKTIKAYPIPKITFDLSGAVYTDDVLSVNTTLADMDGLTATWYVDNTYGFQDWDTYIDGKLDNNGGSIRFIRAGVYDLQARVTDATGRVFLFNSGKVEVLPVLSLTFELPATGYTDTQIDVRTRGNNNVLPVEWTLMKDGETVPLDQAVSGTLNAQGGNIRFPSAGEYRLTASMTDALGRVFSYSAKISIYPLYNCNFSMPSSIHTGQSFVVNIGSDVKLNGKSIAWTLSKDSTAVAVSDYFKGGLSNSGGTVQVDVSGSYVLTATVTDELNRTFTYTQAITVANSAPAKPTLTAAVIRTSLNGKFLVNLSANSTDPDGDAITYEYDGKASDNYYAVGTYTVKVRAKDGFGGVSDWGQVTFTVSNSAPTTPVITRTPSGNSVAPGTAVTITAASTDPDGDVITYVWDGRNAQTQTYPLGKNTVKVKAVDAAGVESPWAAITFFVADESHGGGMMLTGPDSIITEDGVEGATITKWTFTVPPVTGHSANYDYGEVSGYNIQTGKWERLTNVSFDASIGSSFAATDGNTGRVYSHNGVYMSGTLQPGIYSKLQFYYYTPHDCMYNKSNITYSVEFYFS